MMQGKTTYNNNECAYFWHVVCIQPSTYPVVNIVQPICSHLHVHHADACLNIMTPQIIQNIIYTSLN